MHKHSEKLWFLFIKKMASDEEVAVLSDSELKSEETSETESIGIGCSTSLGKFRSDFWNYFSKCTATVGKGYSPIMKLEY